MNTMTRLVALVLTGAALLFLTGCATGGDGQGWFSQGSDLGSYSINITPEGGVTADSRTLRGGPDVEVTKPDGTVVRVSSSNKQIISEILKRLAP